MKRIKRMLSWLTALVVVMSGLVYPENSLAASSETLETVNATYSLDLWHYSGGYWKVGNVGSEKISFKDNEIKNLSKTLEANNPAVFTAKISSSLAETLKSGTEGVDWTVSVGRYKINPELIFDTDSLSIDEISGNSLSFSIVPRFNFNKWGETINSFLNFGFDVPLIDIKYGRNIYSIFGNGLSAVQASGWYDESNPTNINNSEASPYIHPLMIKNSSGALKSGYKLLMGGKIYDSDGFSIGNGTFSGGGACGLHFEFPCSLVFKTISAEPETPEEPEAPETPEEPELEGLNADFTMPDFSYEGHPVTMTDCSSFEYEGATIGAQRAYSLGIASGRFSASPSSGVRISKRTKTSSEGVFNNSGNYNVTLKISGGGLTDSATKPIEIRKTPSLNVSLMGTQKENRKQSLYIIAAQSPAYPINALDITITEPESGEAISVSKAFSGSESAPKNSAHIKYRSLYEDGSDDNFVCVRLDFLTKFTESRTLNYTVSARDSRGNSDRVSADFNVAPDLPPVAEIGLEECYLRAEGGGPAQITVSDLSISDGDELERSWTYKAAGETSARPASSLPGFMDKSFGSGKDIIFNKDSVGEFTMGLTVKDIWTEETLEEYVSEADRKSSSAEKSSLVDNTAPRVSLSTLKTDTAEILLTAPTDALRDNFKTQLPQLEKLLREEGISAEISVESLESASGDTNTFIGRSSENFGLHWTDNDFWKRDYCCADGDTVYICDATLVPTTETTVWYAYSGLGTRVYNLYPEQPYTIRAYSAKNMALKWSTVIGKNLIDAGKTYAKGAYIGQDLQNRYLYFVMGGKTVLIDKNSGAILSVLNFEMGRNNSVSENYIYSYKDSGIWRLPLSGGEPKLIRSMTIYTGENNVKLRGGSDSFVCSIGTVIYMASFEPETEKLSLVRLGTTEFKGISAPVKVLGIDANGRVLMNSYSGDYVYVRAYESDGRLTKAIELYCEDYPEYAVQPVWSGDGSIRYFSLATEDRTGRNGVYKYWTYARVYGLESAFVSDQAGAYGNDFYPSDLTSPYTVHEAGGTAFVGLPNKEGVALLFKFDLSTGAASGGKTGGALKDINASIPNSFWGGHRSGSLSLMDYDEYGAIAYEWEPERRTYVLRHNMSADQLAENYKAAHFSYDKSFSYYAQLEPETSAKDIADAVIALKDSGEYAMTISGEKAGASAVKSYKLVPGKTYYYEYETDSAVDILKPYAVLSRPAGTTQEGYIVTGNFTEDFNDEDTNSFFEFDTARIYDGRLRLSYLMSSKLSSNRLQSGDKSELKFTVPAGKQAVLSFDYRLVKEDSGVGSACFYLAKDGGAPVQWDKYIDPYGTFTGSYMNRAILSAGTYSLSAMVRDYTSSKNHESIAEIDNISLSFVVPQTIAQYAGEDQLETESSISQSGSSSKVSGVFNTPWETAVFSKIDAEYVGGRVNSYCSYVGPSGSSNDKATETINIPAGRTAIYAGLNVSSSPSRASKRDYNVSWTWEGMSFGSFYTLDGSNMTLNIDRNALISGFNLGAGTHVLNGSFSAYRGAWGDITGVNLFLSKPGVSVPAAAQKELVFRSGNGLYCPGLVYDGTTKISFEPKDGGTARISNFRLYYIEGGRKIYAESVGFKRSDAVKNWTAKDAKLEISAIAATEEPAKIYAKGETVNQKAMYSDYENDPSKRSYWRYTHTPLSDGLHPQSGQILSAPITKFFIDGKYVVEHWQEDSTGNILYDKLSNVDSKTFYIGGELQGAPWVKTIKTDPSKVESGDNYSIKVTVDDNEKDPLAVRIELYFEGGASPIKTKTVSGLTAGSNGVYPEITMPAGEAAKEGRYEVVVSVSDGISGSVKEYAFIVAEDRGITGTVSHTAAWDEKRLEWNNAAKTNNKISPRGPEKFWPGEALVLNAVTKGNPTKVSVQLLGYSQYTATLVSKGGGSWGGSINDSSMQTVFAKLNGPVTVRFTAWYPNGTKTCDVIIYFDQSEGSYYQLHRLY